MFLCMPINLHSDLCAESVFLIPTNREFIIDDIHLQLIKHAQKRSDIRHGRGMHEAKQNKTKKTAVLTKCVVACNHQTLFILSHVNSWLKIFNWNKEILSM